MIAPLFLTGGVDIVFWQFLNQFFSNVDIRRIHDRRAQFGLPDLAGALGVEALRSIDMILDAAALQDGFRDL